MKLLRNVLAVIGGLTLISLLLAATIFPFLGHLLESADAPGPADALVLLNGNPVRALYGAELYKKGLAPIIYVGRPEFTVSQDLVKLGLSITYQEDRYVEVLGLKGVPRNAIRLYGHGHVSTVEEAEALHRELNFTPKSLLLVTAPYHSRRVRLTFQKVFPETTILVCPDPQEALAPRWWKDRLSAINVVLETSKMIHYLGGGVFRSNPPATAP